MNTLARDSPWWPSGTPARPAGFSFNCEHLASGRRQAPARAAHQSRPSSCAPAQLCRQLLLVRLLWPLLAGRFLPLARPPRRVGVERRGGQAVAPAASGQRAAFHVASSQRSRPTCSQPRHSPLGLAQSSGGNRYTLSKLASLREKIASSRLSLPLNRKEAPRPTFGRWQTRVVGGPRRARYGLGRPTLRLCGRRLSARGTARTVAQCARPMRAAPSRTGSQASLSVDESASRAHSSASLFPAQPTNTDTCCLPNVFVPRPRLGRPSWLAGKSIKGKRIKLESQWSAGERETNAQSQSALPLTAARPTLT